MKIIDAIAFIFSFKGSIREPFIEPLQAVRDNEELIRKLKNRVVK